MTNLDKTIESLKTCITLTFDNKSRAKLIKALHGLMAVRDKQLKERG
jgi:hypothetical protein